MSSSIIRFLLVALVVFGIFAASSLIVTADPDIPTEPVPPMDHPGQRVAFWMTRLPKLVYADGEPIELRFTAFPMTDAVLVWNLDISTYMTLGSEFEGSDGFSPSDKARLSAILTEHGIAPNSADPRETLQQRWRNLSEAQRDELLDDLDQFGFRYEPWASTLDMLQGFWTESGLCDGMLALVSGPGGSRLLHHPCLGPRASIEVLDEHGPSGWYEFSQGLSETIEIAVRYASQGHPTEVFVVNRGPVLDVDRSRIPEMIDQAIANDIRVNVVPMGNEPGPRMRFPYLKPLRELAEATGGLVYYQPNLANLHDFSMLPDFVPQIMREFYGRMGQIERGVEVARRATLVLAPSEHVEFTSPNLTRVATDGASVHYGFENLTIGEPQSVDISLRVSTNITETLLPIFRGSTRWADPRYSYFEWVDQAGQHHRHPVPQRVISVTTGSVPPAAASPTATHTPTPRPSPTPTPTRIPPTPTPSPTATATPMPTATPVPRRPTPTPTLERVDRNNTFFLALIIKNRSNPPGSSAYPAPNSTQYVEIPVLDAVIRRFFP